MQNLLHPRQALRRVRGSQRFKVQTRTTVLLREPETHRDGVQPSWQSRIEWRDSRANTLVTVTLAVPAHIRCKTETWSQCAQMLVHAIRHACGQASWLVFVWLVHS